MECFYVSVLLLSVYESVSSKVPLYHLNQGSFYPIDPNITELSSSIELEGDIFELHSYIPHQFFEYIKCQHNTTFASVISIKTESQSALVISESNLIQVYVEESEFDVVGYVCEVLYVYLPSMQCLISSIDMVHLCEIGLKGIIFLVLCEQSNLMPLGNPVIDIILLDEVIEEPPRDAEFGSKHLIEEYFVLWDEETIVKEFIPLVWLIFSEFFQVVNLNVR